MAFKCHYFIATYEFVGIFLLMANFPEKDRAIEIPLRTFRN